MNFMPLIHVTKTKILTLLRGSSNNINLVKKQNDIEKVRIAYILISQDECFFWLEYGTTSETSKLGLLEELIAQQTIPTRFQLIKQQPLVRAIS